MEIQKQGEEKWIRPTYGMYLTQVSAVEDKDRLLVKQVCVTAESSADEWKEIDAEEAEAIQKAKKAASRQSFEYPEAEVNQSLSLLSMTINTMNLTDEQALKVKSLYPKWSEFIGKSIEANYKINHNDKLYKTLQKVATVLDQDGYRPGEVGSEALYEEINETNAGTKEDPIPYNNNMELFVGKYYSQDGVTYRCTRNTEQAVYQNLKDLVGIYVEVVTE